MKTGTITKTLAPLKVQVLPKTKNRGRQEAFAEVICDIFESIQIPLFNSELENILAKELAEQNKYIKLWLRTVKTRIPKNKRKSPKEKTPRAEGYYCLHGREDLARLTKKIAEYLGLLDSQIPQDGVRLMIELADIWDLTPIVNVPGDEETEKQIAL